MGKRIVTYILGIESSRIGQPCYKCRKLFKNADMVTSRGTNNKIKRSIAKIYHKKCWDNLFYE